MSIYNAVEIKDRILQALDEADEIELNLAQVLDLDTAGFQLLVLAKREALSRKKTLRLVAHSKATREVLDLYGMMGYFGDPVVIPADDSAARASSGATGTRKGRDRK
jgi:anti-anti-sigma factor